MEVNTRERVKMETACLRRVQAGMRRMEHCVY